MSVHSKPAHAEKSAEKPRARNEKAISGKEGKISGISKTKHKLRGIKLAAKKAAVAVAIAAGLAAGTVSTPASAKNMSSLTGITDIRSSMSVEELPAYAINLPEEIAPFPKGQSPQERIETLSKQDLVNQLLFRNNRHFTHRTSGGEIEFIFDNYNSRVVVSGGKEPSFILDFSQYGMVSPVARLEETKDMKAILHIIDVQTGTDLTLTFPLFGQISAEHVKAKAFQDAKTAESGQVSRSISEIVNAGEKILEAEKPKTIEEAREVYSRMGAEMVNQLREDCSSAPSEQAPELAKRGQAVITAVLLRLYVSDDENALMELDKLRADPKINEKALESFSWKNGILEEFQKIFPQCSATLEE